MAQSQVRLKLEERPKWQEFHFSTKIINKLQSTEFKMYFTFIAQLQVVSDCKMELFWGSLRTADVFPVVASLPPKNMERSHDRKYVCCSQAKSWIEVGQFRYI